MLNGRVYFFDGADGSLVEAVDSPDGSGNLFGGQMVSAEDMNGNGWPDVLVLEPASTYLPATIYVIDGGTREVIYSVPDPFAGSGFGYTPLAGVQDLDGDDFPEFLGGVSTGIPSSTLIHVWSGTPIGIKSFGQACPTAAGEMPRIGATGSAALGTSWKVHLSRVVPDLPAFLAVGMSASSSSGAPLPLALGSMGMPGCELLVALDAVFQATTVTVGSGKGAAAVALKIPQDESFLGSVLYAQWAVLNPSGSASLGATTRGLEVTLLVGPGADLPPEIDSITPATVEALVPGPEQTVAITGSGFAPSTVVAVDGVELAGSPPPFTVVSSELITLDMPQIDHLGPVEVRVSNSSGWSAADITVVAPELPKLQAGSGAEPAVLVGADHLDVVMSSLPGDLFLLYWSTSDLPSSWPGVLELEIGAGFASLFHAGSFAIDPVHASAALDAGSLSGAVPPFTHLYLEGVVVRESGLAFPLDTSNGQHVWFLF
jgi:hypothetical protein